MDEVKFEKEEDKKKVEVMIKRVMHMFMEAGCVRCFSCPSCGVGGKVDTRRTCRGESM